MKQIVVYPVVWYGTEKEYHCNRILNIIRNYIIGKFIYKNIKSWIFEFL
jgi:hypothetical protein